MITIIMPDGSQWNIPAERVGGTQADFPSNAAFSASEDDKCRTCDEWLGTESSQGYAEPDCRDAARCMGFG